MAMVHPMLSNPRSEHVRLEWLIYWQIIELVST